jgi:hypothetical protein
MIALYFVASLLLQQRQLLCRFHAFDGHSHAKRIAEKDDGAHDCKGFPVLDDVNHKGLVDLDLVEGKAAEVTQNE